MADASGFLSWFISFRNPIEIWKNEPTFLLCEIVYLLMAAMTLKHAVRHGGCNILLWLAICLHGLTTECVSYFVPDVDNFWHAQSTVILVEKRLPLHIFFFYPATLYTASIAVSKLKLPFSAEPFAVGLADVLLDFPFDIMGIKLLWWTWHDTDPNIFDRHYWVPWTSYIFHMSFASSVAFIFHGMRRLLIGAEKYQPSNSWFKEVVCVILTGLFSMPLGVIQFIFFYHIPHDVYGIHTEVVVCAMIMVYGLIVWRSDRNPDLNSRGDSMSAYDVSKKKIGQSKEKRVFDEISFNVILHFLFYLLLVVFAKPENMKSTGLHQEIGNCTQKTPVHTPLGQVLYKKTYLCSSEYDEGYFDWHCTPDGQPPVSGSKWYTLCGLPYPNHAEYIFVVSAFCILGFTIYYQMLWCSARYVASGKKKVKDS
ncbi:uncharacterized protein LOC116308317 [Actinia tenebrosa]|uniref:Uncharacterized protein LOC116308317 n=1 Tax=Actinia tenebrosa TaxID=6105 RepID=A0A6P8JA02_ACTTE|nr:uncharacterized protein LOC116308317 [Actinia tenebrosa]